MKLLIDTHIFLWFVSGDRRLAAPAQSRICDPANEVFLSVASVWECVVKSQIGKLPLPQPAEVYVPQQRASHRIASLEIDEGAIVLLAQLPPLHRDPFDRILIAQAQQHQLTLLTVDSAILAYNLPFLVPA